VAARNNRYRAKARPAARVKDREIAPYIWAHPDEETRRQRIKKSATEEQVAGEPTDNAFIEAFKGVSAKTVGTT
jgi:hypothetical protein